MNLEANGCTLLVMLLIRWAKIQPEINVHAKFNLLCSKNSRKRDEGKEIVADVTVPDFKGDVENDGGIADITPVPSTTSLRWLEAHYDCDPVRLHSPYMAVDKGVLGGAEVPPNFR